MYKYKKFYIHKDITGAISNFSNKNIPIEFTQNEIVHIDEEDVPSLYAIIPDNSDPFIAKMTYVPNGHITPEYESGCLAWVKIKDKEDDLIFKKVALSPEWIELYPGNAIYITGARSFDAYFTIQFEYYDLNL